VNFDERLLVDLTTPLEPPSSASPELLSRTSQTFLCKIS